MTASVDWWPSSCVTCDLRILLCVCVQCVQGAFIIGHSCTQGYKVAGLNPSCLMGWRWGYTLHLSPVYFRATWRDKWPCIRTYCRFKVASRTACREPTWTQERTYKLHTGPGINAVTFLLRRHSANIYTVLSVHNVLHKEKLLYPKLNKYDNGNNTVLKHLYLWAMT